MPHFSSSTISDIYLPHLQLAQVIASCKTDIRKILVIYQMELNILATKELSEGS